MLNVGNTIRFLLGASLGGNNGIEDFTDSGIRLCRISFDPNPLSQIQSFCHLFIDPPMSRSCLRYLLQTSLLETKGGKR